METRTDTPTGTRTDSAGLLADATLTPELLDVRSDEAVEEMAARLRLSSHRLARRLRRQTDTGLSPSQLSLLTTVEVRGPMTLGALAEHERVSPPTITKVVAKLESMALVRREADAADRRVQRLTITPEGVALLDESRRRKTAWLTGRIRDLGPDERARLAAALDVLDALVSGDAP
jgi:DNA-binding MarR family transcriptional regulator